MAVFQEQDSDSFRFVIRPNCALTWQTTKHLIWFFGACLGAVSVFFVSMGAWLVLPFAGLELAALAAGFYASALSGHTREVVEITGPVVRVLRGRRRLHEVAGFAANWTQVVLERDLTNWYPSRLLLRSQGRQCEIAARIVDTEREELAAALKERLGYALSGHGKAKLYAQLPAAVRLAVTPALPRPTFGNQETGGPSSFRNTGSTSDKCG